ncbi:MAG: pyruvate, phosphate dikinase [Candidatus Bipolaricaulota bacterium]|nr:pyruvate, phosphate dikinase [Candidatus Bipolaricaulota bacterium]
MAKYVYLFGPGVTEGSAEMRDLLGGKGANLAEMVRLGLNVPPGFTITTEVCTYYYAHGRSYPPELEGQVRDALATVERLTGRRFGDPRNPLLLSVRSGARSSMPGMMETVLNVGLTPATLKGLIAQTGNERFALDAYRRLITMYADVVMEKAAGIEAEDEGIRRKLEHKLHRVKKRKGYRFDTELTAADLRALVRSFKRTVETTLGRPFPDDPWDQLWGAIGAVFASWMGRRAVEYRRIEGIPDTWGTAVNVQAMVFGNMGEDSATGVAFTRNPATGENAFYGEYLVNAQGEDVVAGIRTPAPLNDHSKNEQSKDLPTLAVRMPGIYRELEGVRAKLERHYRDMQDIEFTVERGVLYILQCRAGKRSGVAAVRIALDMLDEGLIDERTAVLRVPPAQLVELLLPRLDPVAARTAPLLARGLPAGPGAAVGRVVFTSADAVAWTARGEEVILVREETSPEDVDGIHKAQGVLTTRGGLTSHAALVARGWGKCCIVGCGEIEIAQDGKSFTTARGETIHLGDWISLNGTEGKVYRGKLPLIGAMPEDDPYYVRIMALADRYRRLRVRTNADTPKDAAQGIRFGAEGIGLFRTEHMFYGEGSEKPLFLLRKMIMSATPAERRKALEELFPYVKADVKATLEVMDGRPVTIRLLDPPLHEFVPHDRAKQQALAKELGISLARLRKRAESLREANPMLGHRGVRLGITYPEVTEMQIRAILEAAAELLLAGRKAYPEIMIPVTSTVAELFHEKKTFDRVLAEVKAKFGLSDLPCLFGTMIEIPRAALTGGQMAKAAQFFSFGTNDLTQMGFGFSRDDIGSFLPEYLERGILKADPFQTLDQEGIGELIKIAIERGRATRPELKVGICGEHGGDPESVIFCHRVGMDYVSCSPFRVPIARLAAAHAALREG